MGSAGRRDTCAVCGRSVRGLPDAHKEGKLWFCSQGHFLSYTGDFGRGASRKPLRTLRKVVMWTLIVFGVLFIGIVALSFTSLGEEEQATPGAQRSSEVGKAVVLHGVSYRVMGARTTKRLYAAEKPTKYDEPRRARGVYVVVNIAYKNVGNEPASGALEGSTFVGGNGKTYTTDTLSRNTVIYQLQPDFSNRGRLVFDVSPPAVRGGKLKLADCLGIGLFEETDEGCATETIDLGLR